MLLFSEEFRTFLIPTEPLLQCLPTAIKPPINCDEKTFAALVLLWWFPEMIRAALFAANLLLISVLPSVFASSEVTESANLWRASPTGGVVEPDLICRSKRQACRQHQVCGASSGSCAGDAAGWYHGVHNSQRDTAREISAAGLTAAQVSAWWTACEWDRCLKSLSWRPAVRWCCSGHSATVWPLSEELIGKDNVTLFWRSENVYV